MSTKAIRECLLILKQDMPVSRGVERMADKGLQTLDAIERAAGAWVASDMGELPEEHATTMESIAKEAP